MLTVLPLKEKLPNSDGQRGSSATPLAHSSLRFRFLLIALCLSVAGGIGSQLFNLTHSTSPTLRFYVDQNPFEVYELRLQGKFNVFSRPTAGGSIPARFVFGVSAKDNGNFFDPDDVGVLELIPLDVFQAQEWLADFCDNLRVQNFYLPNYYPFGETCFFEFFRGWVNASCSETSFFRKNDGLKVSDFFTVPWRRRCCNLEYPLKDRVEFDTFLRACASEMEGRPPKTGLKFDGDTLVSVHYQVNTNHAFTGEFEPMNALYNNLEQFRKSQLITAPAGTGVEHFFFVTSFVNPGSTAMSVRRRDRVLWSVNGDCACRRHPDDIVDISVSAVDDNFGRNRVRNLRGNWSTRLGVEYIRVHHFFCRGRIVRGFHHSLLACIPATRAWQRRETMSARCTRSGPFLCSTVQPRRSLQALQCHFPRVCSSTNLVSFSCSPCRSVSSMQICSSRHCSPYSAP